MAKTASVFTRVEPEVKARAEAVLDRLGISMSAAMEMYLRQIALQRKIPFEMALPNEQLISYNALSEEQFNALMDDAVKSYADGKFKSAEDFDRELKAQLNI